MKAHTLSHIFHDAAEELAFWSNAFADLAAEAMAKLLEPTVTEAAAIGSWRQKAERIALRLGVVEAKHRSLVPELVEAPQVKELQPLGTGEIQKLAEEKVTRGHLRGGAVGQKVLARRMRALRHGAEYLSGSPTLLRQRCPWWPCPRRR